MSFFPMFGLLSSCFSHSLISFILATLRLCSFHSMFPSFCTWEFWSFVPRYIIYTFPVNIRTCILNYSSKVPNVIFEKFYGMCIPELESHNLLLLNTYLLFILLPFFFPPNPNFFSL